MLRLFLLGRFHAQWNRDQNLTFPSHKTRALLAYLATDIQPQTRTEVATLLWPESDEAKARNNLRVTLFRLRKVLDTFRPNSPSLLNTDRVTISLSGEQRSDVSQFQSLVKQIEQQPLSNRVELAEQAVNLYQGEFLAGFAAGISDNFDNWLRLTRQRLHLDIINQLDFLIDHHFAQTNYEQVITLAQRQIRLEAWREKSYQRLMLAYANLGQTTEALRGYQTCRDVLMDMMGLEVSADLTDLATQMRSGQWKPTERQLPVVATETQAAPPQSPRHNLPRALPTFFPRDIELLALEKLFFVDKRRWVTLVGPGGIGKSRLAVELAWQLQHRFADGVWFIELAGLRPSNDSREQIATAIADVLNLSLVGGNSAETQLTNYLSNKQLLLILDNFEHILSGADVVYNLLNLTERVTIVCTSREPLHFQAEQLYWLSGLSTPTNELGDQAIKQHASVQLFIERASRLQPTLNIDANALRDVAAICRWLNGSPLGIELAASLMLDLSVAEVRQTLQNSLDLLYTKMRDVPQRHQSIRTVLQHSWERLRLEEQALLMRLSVFQGSFSRAAVEAVCEVDVGLLTALADVSLVEIVAEGRYRLHEVVRQFSAEFLPHSSQIQQRHAAYYLTWLSSMTAELQGQAPQLAVAAVSENISNIRSAWHSAHSDIANELVRAAITPLSVYYQIRGLSREGVTAFAQAIQDLRAAGDQMLLTQLIIEQARFHLRLSEYDKVTHLLSPLVSAETHSLGHISAFAHILLAETAWRKTDFTTAQDYLKQAKARIDFDNEQQLAGWYFHHLGVVQDLLGQYAAAQESIEQAIIHWQMLNNRRLEMNSSNSLGMIMLHGGNLAESKRRYRDAMQIAEEIEERNQIAILLGNLGEILLQEGDLDKAADYLQRAYDLSAELGSRFILARQCASLAILNQKQGAYAISLAFANQALSICQSLQATEAVTYVQTLIQSIHKQVNTEELPTAPI